MMKTVQLTTDVFAQIWALREPGEHTEDAVLRRVLQVPDTGESDAGASAGGQSGFYDRRFQVFFPEGFTVFRSYLGDEFEAQAQAGCWVLQDGSVCKSLNALSRAIGAKTENAWKNWFYLDEDGEVRPVSDLRDPTKVRRRTSTTEHNLQDGSVNETIATGSSELPTPIKKTWREDVRLALERLGGEASLHEIYKEVANMRSADGRSLPRSLEAVVRARLEENSSDSDSFKGDYDLFEMAERKGSGTWRLR